MLDRHLADLYAVKPIRLREQIKRNSKRFPEDFMFQLRDDEVEYLVSQYAIPSKKHLGGALPYVFTEQGVAGISGVLTSDCAIAVNINIMRAFETVYHIGASLKDLGKKWFAFSRIDASALTIMERIDFLLKN